MSQALRNLSIKVFKDNLKNNKEAMQYLISRGLSEQAIDFFNIGFADGNLRRQIAQYNFSEEDMIESRLFCLDGAGKNYEFFRNRIMLPTMVMGNALYMSGRDFGGKSDRKYLNLAVPNNNLINEEILMKRPQYVILSEGYIDCYSLIMAKFPAVAIAGCNRKKKNLLEKLLCIPKVYIMFDYDANGSGQNGAIKTAYALCRMGHRNVRIINIPSMGHNKVDINDMMLAFKDKFQDIVKGLILQASKPFHELEQYKAMERDEVAEIDTTNFPMEESIKIYTSMLPLKPVGNKLMRCLCPFHKEKTPSFTVYLKNAYAVCFGCGLSFDNGKEFQDMLNNNRRAMIF